MTVFPANKTLSPGVWGNAMDGISAASGAESCNTAQVVDAIFEQVRSPGQNTIPLPTVQLSVQSTTFRGRCLNGGESPSSGSTLIRWSYRPPSLLGFAH
jgi:hypothetical protein